MKAYIDDMLVKSRLRGDHLAQLQEAFELMRRHLLRLNLEKCVFRVRFGNFLGFLVSQRGIKMALGQVKVITQMQSLITKKQIQTITGKLTALNRFIYKCLDRLRPFFATLKGAHLKGLGPECDKAFHAIKEYVASPLSLSQPINGEDLYLYLAASTITMRATLVALGEDGKHI